MNLQISQMESTLVDFSLDRPLYFTSDTEELKISEDYTGNDFGTEIPQVFCEIEKNYKSRMQRDLLESLLISFGNEERDVDFSNPLETSLTQGATLNSKFDFDIRTKSRIQHDSNFSEIVSKIIFSLSSSDIEDYFEYATFDSSSDIENPDWKTVTLEIHISQVSFRERIRIWKLFEKRVREIIMSVPIEHDLLKKISNNLAISVVSGW